jgi:hypothetical protein
VVKIIPFMCKLQYEAQKEIGFYFETNLYTAQKSTETANKVQFSLSENKLASCHNAPSYNVCQYVNVILESAGM